jgi:hypothetical protein
MGKSSSPSSPDPYTSAAAQYQYGTLGAAYNAALNNVDTTTPTGSTDWNVTGYSPTGAPEYTETSSLSAPEQSLLSGQQSLEGNAESEEAQTQAQGLPNISQLQNFGNEAQQADYSTLTQTLNPEFSQEGEQLDASLRNSGATPGTPAYDNAITAFNANMGSAYDTAENQAFGQGLSSQSQLLGDATTEQTTPINELESLQSATPTAGAAATGTGASTSAPDIMSAFNQQYQGQLNSYNASVGSSNALTGDAAGLLGSYLMYAALA